MIEVLITRSYLEARDEGRYERTAFRGSCIPRRLSRRPCLSTTSGSGSSGTASSPSPGCGPRPAPRPRSARPASSAAPAPARWWRSGGAAPCAAPARARPAPTHGTLTHETDQLDLLEANSGTMPARGLASDLRAFARSGAGRRTLTLRHAMSALSSSSVTICTQRASGGAAVASSAPSAAGGGASSMKSIESSAVAGSFARSSQYLPSAATAQPARQTTLLLDVASRTRAREH